MLHKQKLQLRGCIFTLFICIPLSVSVDTMGVPQKIQWKCWVFERWQGLSPDKPSLFVHLPFGPISCTAQFSKKVPLQSLPVTPSGVCISSDSSYKVLISTSQQAVNLWHCPSPRNPSTLQHMKTCSLNFCSCHSSIVLSAPVSYWAVTQSPVTHNPFAAYPEGVLQGWRDNWCRYKSILSVIILQVSMILQILFNLLKELTRSWFQL